MKKLLICLSVFASMNSYSNTNMKCAEVELRNLGVGTICESTTGNLFERVSIDGKLAVKDLSEDGLIWFDEFHRVLYGHMIRDVIEKKCDSNGLAAPSIEELSSAHEKGIREAFNPSKLTSRGCPKLPMFIQNNFCQEKNKKPYEDLTIYSGSKNELNTFSIFQKGEVFDLNDYNFSWSSGSIRCVKH